jgi:FPC/CPF motif-containing protein YcgG
MKKYTENRIREFILDDHPCVMAQSLFADDSVTINSYDDIEASESCISLLNDLEKYVHNQDFETKNFESFIAVFRNNKYEDEKSFENALWKLLNDLHKLNVSDWDEDTSSDTSDSNFSFSLFGTSFYIVGMHPGSSRYSRKSPYTMIVFNLHNQFEKLREINRYTRVRDLIRRRDKAFQGSINPMLKDFGTESEAKQYSGRKVEDNWKCPYKFD